MATEAPAEMAAPSRDVGVLTDAPLRPMVQFLRSAQLREHCDLSVAAGLDVQDPSRSSGFFKFF